jgi:catechol 2,3-dioxygenase-like lactoylglutathione lyase family enzyme
MITRMTHATIYVTDHDEARAFYTEKLGFEVRTDQVMDGFRWLTVAPPKQSDLEIVLMELKPGYMMEEDTVAQLRELVAKGALGTGVLETDDCRTTYEELAAKGVEFLAAPEEKPYGIEAVFRDNSGNWFSLTQHLR